MMSDFFKSPEEEAEYHRVDKLLSELPPTQKDIPHQKPGITLTSLRDLLSEPTEDAKWLVDGLITSGGLSAMVAKPKVGKSTVARQLALSVARGEDFLGFKTIQGKVIYLALEERRADVKAHFARMGATGDEDLKVFAGMAPAQAIKEFRAVAEVERPALIIVDTLARLVRIKDLNDYSQTTSGLEPVLALAREVGSHVCMLHHAKKGDGRGIDSILGSTGLAGSVDTIILLNRSDKYRTISTIQRVGQDIPETVMEFDVERGWSSLAGSREECEIGQIKNEIIEFLSGQTEPLLESAIHEETEGKRTHKQRALRELVKEGKVTRLGEGKRNQPYLYHLSGIQVPAISPVPEYQNPKSDVTPHNSRAVSGTRNLENIALPVESPEPEIDYDTLEREAIKNDGGTQ